MGDTRDMTSVQVGDADDLADIFLRAGVRLAAIACMPLGDIRRSRSAIVGRPIRSSRHTVIVPTSGVGGHIVDSSDFQLQPGRAAHILPGQVQRFVPDQELEGWVLSIEPLVCPPGLFDIARPSPVVCLGPSVDVAHALVSSLISPDILPATAQERLRISIASVLLELIAGANDGPEIPNELAREYELVADFRRELEFHYLDTRSVSDYASMIGCSAKTLTRATKRLLGQTPKQIIDARVTYAAIRLLANTDISVNWISTKLGFSQQSNFAKFFCRQVDMTPAAYREACLSSGTMFPVNSGSSFT